MSNRIQKVLIVGGGTAGWMTASVLLQILGRGFPIQLIESDAISTVGVGEATIPSLQELHKLLGISENLFVKETQATFKLGIEFKDWGEVGESYIHSFGLIGKNTGLVQFYHYWLRMMQIGQAEHLDQYTINTMACFANKFTRGSTDPAHRNSPIALMAHAFHFDAGLFAAFLRVNCEKNGIQRTEGKVVEVETDPETGFVTSVKMENGDTHTADLFIDCSGFRGLLIEQTLKTGYEDWSHWLPCNSAVTVACESVRPLTPYTRATARPAGWQWRIPLQSRIGNGHVFCSNYMSADEATSILLNNLDGPPIGEPRHLRFVTGRRSRVWNKNVIAVGLSAGFIEPLESTSIHLIQTALTRLIRLFPNQVFDEADAEEYNRLTAIEFEQVRDFIILHYTLNRREEEFWRYLRTMDLPDSLERKMRLFEANGRIFRDNNELFSESGWLQVMLGQGLEPRGYDPLADQMATEDVARMMANVKEVVAKTVEQLPTHEAFIEEHCKAPSLRR